MSSSQIQIKKPEEESAAITLTKDPELVEKTPRKKLIKMSTSSIKFHSTTGPALEAASPMLSNQLKMEHQAEILAL